MNLNLGGFNPAGMMQTGNALMALAQLPADQREQYVNEHPELLNEGVIGAALTAAGLADPATKKKIAEGGLQVARQLNSADLIAQAQAMLGRKAG
jgi:hypothetical protein